jgi:thiol-disulfide isomerase/thioredoxin
MKSKLIMMALAFLTVTVARAQSFEFQYHGQSLGDGDVVTIAAGENDFGELACETNPSANPTDGLMLKLLTGTSSQVTATLEIEHNTLDATMLQWCMGGECTPVNDATTFTKSFTASTAEQVQFDATDIKATGYLMAKLTVRRSLESHSVYIQFTNGESAGGGDEGTWWGYMNDGDFDVYDQCIGTGSPMALMAGIYVPANSEQMGEAVIKAVRVYLASSVLSSLSNMKIWISKTLPKKVSAADYVQNITTTLKADANDFQLDTPYQVNNEGFYIGYYVKSTKGYFIRAVGDGIPNSFWVGNPEAGMDWTDASTLGIGKLAFQVLAEGVTVKDRAATPSDFGQVIVVKGKTTYVPVEIVNYGKETINSISYTITTNGRTGRETRISAPSITTNSVGTVNIPFSADASARKYEKVVTITMVNGAANEAKVNTAQGYSITVSEQPDVTPVVEEFTGTWCGYCPYGIVGMQNVHDKYGDDVVLIAAHNSDPMEIAAYDDVVNTYADGFPSAVIDRATSTHAYYILDYMESAFNRVTQGSIEVTATWADDNKTTVDFTTNTKFVYSEDDGQYAIAFVLVEDGLKGTGSSWAQTNYLNGQSGLPSDMKFWRTAGSSVSGLEYDHVAVAAWNAKDGINGSVSSSIKADEVQSFNYTARIAAASLSLIQDKSRLKAVALLIDRSNGTIVNAAQMPIQDASSFVTGDVTGDGKVDVSDYIGVANYILCIPQEGFNEEAGDVNEDGTIDVSDYLGIGNIIHTGSVYGNDASRGNVKQ